MKTNLIVVLAIVIILIAGGGIYFFTQSYHPANNLQPNNSPVTNPLVSAGNGQTKNIQISNFAFSPSSLTINVGDTVTWTNFDSVSHTITSDNGNELSSSTFGNGKTYSHTFNIAGTYTYHCSIHSTMKGTIIVS